MINDHLVILKTCQVYGCSLVVHARILATTRPFSWGALLTARPRQTPHLGTAFGDFSPYNHAVAQHVFHRLTKPEIRPNRQRGHNLSEANPIRPSRGSGAHPREASPRPSSLSPDQAALELLTKCAAPPLKVALEQGPGGGEI
jgi:hypothetical protein